jgi:beta-galactosidase
MLRSGFADRIGQFVSSGGTVLMTYWSGVVDESDLCFLGGVPGQGLREVFGVWEEESQSYYAHEKVAISAVDGNDLGLTGTLEAVDTCSVIHAEGSDVLATYTDQYFAGSPALTVHAYGKGKAYYAAARMKSASLAQVYEQIVADLKIARVMNVDLPSGVTAQLRTDGNTRYVFLLNFNACDVSVGLDDVYLDFVTGETVESSIALTPYEVRILKQ